jgi:O-antigen/teichoic acid export membrane protein
MHLILKRGKIGKQTILVVLGDAINFSSGIVATMILARLIPENIMGTYRQIMYLGPMAVSLSELGLSATIYRFWNILALKQKVFYCKMIVLLSLFLGISASITLALLSPLFSHWYHNPDLRLALLIAAPYPLATIPFMLVRPLMLSHGYFIRATSLETLFSLSSIFSLIVPLWLGCSMEKALFLWIGILLLWLMVIPLIFKKYLWQPGNWWCKGIFQDIWVYLWPIQIGRILGYVTAYMDKIVMSFFLTPQSFAVYSLGAREIPFISVIGFAAANVLMPHLVDDVNVNRYDQVRRRWRLACERTAMATYLFGAFCIWHAEDVIQFLFSSLYKESSVPFRIFAILTFLRVIEYASLAKAFGRSELIMKSAFFGAITMVVLSIPLTWSLEVTGMALAIISASISSAVFLLFEYKKMLRVPLDMFFPWQKLLYLLIISFISVAAGTWLMSPLFALTHSKSIYYLGYKLIILFIACGTIYVMQLIVGKFIKIKIS